MHGFIEDVPLVGFNERFYAENRQAQVLAGNTALESPLNL